MKTVKLKFRCKVCHTNACTLVVKEDPQVDHPTKASELRCPFKDATVLPKWKLTCKSTKEVTV